MLYNKFAFTLRKLEWKMNILFIGDIFGEVGKKAINAELDKIKKKYKIDFTIANAENTTLARGLNWNDYNELVSYGIDFFTMGNHTWHKEEIIQILDTRSNIIRPANIVDTEEISKHGIGTKLVNVKGKKIRITNLLGTTVHFKERQTNPFIKMNEILRKKDWDIHIVDFHSETTSEKNAFFLNFKNRVSAIFGTHTHVQTNDHKIYNNTAYITDVGMTGPMYGVIGAKPDSIINMFKGESDRFRLEEQKGLYQFCAVVLTIDDKTNKPTYLKNIIIYE